MQKYTQTAKNALYKAQQAACDLGHTFIGSEHLLMGLIAEAEGVAAKILEKRSITEEAVREAIAAAEGTGEPSKATPADMTPRTKHIIQVSAQLAVQHNHSYIGTEHILLAIISEQECLAVKILSSLGAGIRDLAGDIVSFFKEFGEPGEPAGENAAEGQPFAAPAGSAPQKGSGKSLSSCPAMRQYGRDLTATDRKSTRLNSSH